MPQGNVHLGVIREVGKEVSLGRKLVPLELVKYQLHNQDSESTYWN